MRSVMPPWAATFCLIFSGCILPKEKKQMQGEIVDVTTRVVALEQALETNVKSQGETANKRIASTRADLDKINLELRRLRGEIDALRVGVVTGQMPGAQNSEESVAAKLDQMSQRLELVEISQDELIDSIKKAGIKKRKKKTERPALTSVSALQSAFDSRRYLHVVQDAPGLESKTKGAEKTQLQFLYAESLYKLGKLRDAALKYNDFLESKPEKKYLPTAKMRMGDCFRHLGEFDTSRIYYEEVLAEFPKSEEAKTAKERLADMTSSTNKG